MWLRFVLLAYSLAATSSEADGGGRFEWGWQLQTPPSGGHPVTAGQYYVRLPETSGVGAEQHVSYQADSSGYHGALAVRTHGENHAHAQTFALGQPAIALLNNQILQNINFNNTPSTKSNYQNSLAVPQVDIYLLQQQLSSLPSNEQNQNTAHILHNPNENFNYVPTYYTNNVLSTPAQYVVDHTAYKHNQNVELIKEENSSTPLPKEAESEPTNDVNVDNNALNDPVQVFKDKNNCTNDDKNPDKRPESKVNYEQPTKLNPVTLSVDDRKVSAEGKFGTKLSASYKVQKGPKYNSNQRQNSRSERIYFVKPTNTPRTTKKSDISDEGISKLVASTQDLISNEDLLTINHAIERDGYVYNDDILKPKLKGLLLAEQSRNSNSFAPSNQARNKITVRAKVGNIVDSEIEHSDDNDDKVLQTSSNEYKFVTPIVVQDSTVNDYKTQVMNNFISTITPYLVEGYELESVKNSLDEDFHTLKNNSSDDDVNVTPRPIGQRYLAAITVGLRLVNSNDTDVLNSEDDHEVSDSEIVSDTVKNPEREKTVVEIQESVPLAITHINDVVVHEWDDDRSKAGPYKITKSLYDQHNDALESSRHIQQNMNKNLYKYGTMKNFGENENLEDISNGEDNKSHDTDEDHQTEIEAQSSNQNHERKEFITSYDNNFGEKIIQPIIIEKEVPITKYVDRFIEKKVPYPEPVEVIKEVQVEKQVPYPVPYETTRIVEKPVEVTKYVDRPQPYPVQVPHPVPVEVRVPYPVEKTVYVDRPVHIPIPIEKVTEKHVVHPVAVPTAIAVPVEVQVPVEHKVLYPVTIEKQVAVPVEVEKRVPVETIVEKQVPVPYPVEKRVPYPVPYETKVPVPYPVERRIPVHIDRIVEKPVTITRFVEKPIHIQVPVPQPVAVPVHVPQPYPVDRIVERKVPYPVPYERIVEKKVEVPVQVRVPYEKIVEKIVEKPVVITKYVDKPYPVEKRVPYPVEKIVEKKVPYAVHVPVEVRVPYPVEKLVERPAHNTMKVPYQFNETPNNPYSYERPDYFLPQKYTAEQHKQGTAPPHIAASNNHPNIYQAQQQQSANQVPQYLQFNRFLNDKESKKYRNQDVQSTAWGNLYASSYQYINNTPEHHKVHFKKTPLLNKYIGYVKNTAPDQYYGPPPVETANHWNSQNVPKNYLVEFKLRRTDRTPRVSNLRIEYGGFKPPLVPSTQVDLDGIPVNKEEDKAK